MSLRALFLAAALAVVCGCSVKRIAINKVGDALATPGTTFTAETDPQLVRDALPFSLKLIESLLAQSPNHRGLLLAAASGFTPYAYAFVEQDADEIEDTDFAKATELRKRAKGLYLRARDYGLRGLEVKHPNFRKALEDEPKSAAAKAVKADVPLLYWTAASWGAAVSLSKNDPYLVSSLPSLEALIDRALALDEGFDSGSIHSFLISYESARKGIPGDAADRARKHFDRAMALSGGHQAGPLVSLAEAVSVPKQDRREFESLLKRALEVDVDAKPEYRLANLIMQKRARWLLSRADRLFLEDETK